MAEGKASARSSAAQSKRMMVCQACGEPCERKNNYQRYCPACGKEALKRATKAWREANRDHINARSQAWASANREKANASSYRWKAANYERWKAANRAWQASDPERARQQCRKWYQENIEKARESARKRAAARLGKNPLLRLHGTISGGIHRSLHRTKDGKRRRPWESLVGYTCADLKAHLERQFTKGMKWSNFGKWHVDHIVPRSSFCFESASDPEFRACWALTNLRPLWAPDNLSKHKRRTHLL